MSALVNNLEAQLQSKKVPPPAVRKALGGTPDGEWNEPHDALSVNRPPSGSKTPKDGRLPALEMPPMGVDPPPADAGDWGDYMESARTMGLGATHNSDVFGQTSNSIFGSTRHSLGAQLLQGADAPETQPLSDFNQGSTSKGTSTVAGSSKAGGAIVGKAWANRPDTAGLNRNFTPKMDEPKEPSYFRNIDVETSLPIDHPHYLVNAPRAIEINKPPVAGKGHLHEVHPSTILQGGAPVPAPPPPPNVPPPVNPSVISADVDVTPGPDIPIQLRVVDQPTGAGYMMGPPTDLKWNINFFAENQRITFNQSEEWKETTMSSPPKPKPLPWHAGRGPWARKIDTTEEALEVSFDKYNCLIESLAVSKIQKLVRQRNRREEGRSWRKWYVVDQAATKLQSAARVLLGRQTAQRHKAVRVLQRWTRGWHARRRVQVLKWKKMEKHMIKVATLLQKVVRGRIGRLKWKQRRLTYTIAAMKIQAVARGRFGRRHYTWYSRSLHRAASCMQKAIRRYLSISHQFRQEREELKAATMLQRVWRGKATRSKLIFRFAEQAWAATMLAASYRGHKGRRRAAQIKQKKWVDEIPLRAAIMMQKAWRKKRIYKMMRVVKEHLRMMRSFCLADSKMELMDFIHGLKGKDLPLHGIVDRHGNTLMHISAQRNKVDVIPLLVKAGLNINVKNGNGWRPLHGAIMNLANDAVRELIRQKASVNAKNTEGYTPLHQACFFDNFTALKILLTKKKKVKPNEQTLDKKYTPLHLAALQGMSKPSIEVMMKFEPSRNMMDSDGLTPVHLAAQLGQAQLLEGLLDGKFNADLRDAEGRTALMTAAQAGNEEAVHQLLIAKSMPYFRDRDGWMAHHYCAEAGMVGVLRRLLEQYDIHPDAPNGDGWSAMHLAATGQDKAQMDIIQMLADDFDADVNCQDNDGRAPVHIAAQEGSMEALELLFGIPHCAREAEDFSGATPMFIALDNNQFNIGRFCVKEGCNYQHRDKGGCNMLMLAIKEDNPHWVDYFLRIKMDLKQVDGRGYNAMHFAAEFNRPKYVHILDQDPQAQDLLIDELKGLTAKSSGWTPLHVAAYAGNVEALEALVAVGCPVDLQDHSGQVALHVGVPTASPCRSGSCSGPRRCSSKTGGEGTLAISQQRALHRPST